MYDAAIALADDVRLGGRYEVYKEEVKDWNLYVRWNPSQKENIVWRQKQFYCFPGSLEGVDFQ